VRLWEQLLSRSESPTEERLSVDDWAQFFGPDYAPFLHHSWAANEESPLVDGTSSIKHNSPTFSLVYARMQVFSQARFAWTKFDGSVAGDLSWTRELELLERPWERGTTADLLARMEMEVSRAGNAFVRRVGKRLVVLPAQWCTLVIGSNEDAEHPREAADAELIGLLYDPPNAEGVVLLPEQFAHYAPIPDPDNRFIGMSWITPSLRDIQGDDLMATHKRKFFENAATPNLAIKFDPSVSVENVKKFKTMIEGEHRGVWNAYKTLYLGGGADPVTVGKDFKEMDFAITQGKGESRLASDAGVPPSWVGFSEGLQGSSLNAGNFASARRRFGDGTMHHLWANASASLAPLVRAPRGKQLWYDVRGMPFMREDAKDAAEVQSKQASTIAELVREGWTPESAVAAVENSDWSLLKHTGRLSVQLQEPGQTPTPAEPAENGDDNDGA
jgi:hypothetical protein